jgi:hypothetical protein
MKNLILTVFILVASGVGALAQENPNTEPLSQLKSDYNQANIVAHVKVKSIKFAAQDVHPLYVVQSEIIEPFKGKIKRGQRLEFYIRLEDDYDINRFLGERIVFLEVKIPIPYGGIRLFAMENSSRPASKATLARMRKIRNVRNRN